MARNGSGVYSLPAGSIVTDGTTIEVSQHNTPLQDLATDANTARPVVAGGTGATTASGARTNLGLGTIATQAASSVDIDGGAIDGTVIGGNSAAAGTFTTINATSINFGGGDLDTYQTGTFTPVLADAISGGNTATGSSFAGRYQRIGDFVHVSIEMEDIDTTGMTGSNAIYIRNLPFTSGGPVGARFTSIIMPDHLTFTNAPFAYITRGVSYALIRQGNSGSAATNLTVSAISSGIANIYFNISYEVA